MQRITALKRVWLIDVLKSSVSLAQKVGAWHCGFLSKQKIEVQPVSSNYMILIDKFLFAKEKLWETFPWAQDFLPLCCKIWEG